MPSTFISNRNDKYLMNIFSGYFRFTKENLSRKENSNQTPNESQQTPSNRNYPTAYFSTIQKSSKNR
jgi:hypothetical protein